MPSVAKVTVKNGPDRKPAADLHMTFSGSGGEIAVDPASVSVDPNSGPGDQVRPKIPSNDKASTNEVVIEWPTEFVDSDAIVKYQASTSHGPLRFQIGHWTTFIKGERRQIGPDIKPEEVTVTGPGSKR